MESLLTNKMVNMIRQINAILLPLLLLSSCMFERTKSESEETGASENERFRLEGKVANQHVPQKDEDWTLNTRILVDGGQYLGIVKPDGTFAVNVPSGSFVVEVVHPQFVFDAVRVEVNSKGKIRARALNFLQPSTVNIVTYPLKLRSRGKTQYFQKREEWRITDLVMNPMVMMMVMPLMMMFVLPKLMSSQDPDAQKEMQSLLSPKENMPDMSEWLTKMFKGGSTTSNKKAIKSSKQSKKQQ